MASQPKRCKYLYDTSEAVPRRTNYRLQLREENLSRGHQQDAAASAKRADDGVGAEVLELSFSDSDSETEGADVPANIGVPESPRGSIADPESSDFTDSEDEDEEHTDAETSQNDEPLYDGARISRSESLLLVMAHSLRYQSSKEATESLLKIIEAHLPLGTDLPLTKYMFFKEFDSAKSLMTAHFWCTACGAYVGKDDDCSGPEHAVNCPVCHKVCDTDEMLKTGQYFITFDLKVQLAYLMAENETQLLSRDPSQIDVGDITNSTSYRALPMSETDISVTWNTDGAPVYESPLYTIWPLLVQVNELPYSLRTRNVLLAGLWFGNGKPYMDSFLKPFVDTMNVLSSSGFTWASKSGTRRTSKVFPGPCTVDSVARCQMLNMAQFNGKYGCLWCEHKGEVVEVRNGHARVYPVSVHPVPPRTQQSIRDHVEEAERKGKPSHGIKGRNILLLLSFFDIVTGCVVDYMHAVCSGFVKTTASIWFSKKAKHPYHLGGRIGEIDSRLQNLKSVWELSRLPQSLKNWKYWKASEWRNFLLFFSPLVLKGILPRKYYKNWLHFVTIMHLLLGVDMSPEHLPHLQSEMLRFLRQYEKLYGKKNMKYNAHLLLHLVQGAENWGSLWNYSTFPFENVNGRLLDLVQGTRYAATQIAEKYLVVQYLSRKISRLPGHSDSSCAKKLLDELLKGYRPHKTVKSCCDIVLYGKGKPSRGLLFYKKFTRSPFTFCVSGLDKSRRWNSYVKVGDKFGQIMEIFVHTESMDIGAAPQVMVKMEVLDTKQPLLPVLHGDICVDSFICVERTEEVIVVDASQIEKCIALAIDRSLYLCILQRNLVVEAN